MLMPQQQSFKIMWSKNCYSIMEGKNYDFIWWFGDFNTRSVIDKTIIIFVMTENQQKWKKIRKCNRTLNQHKLIGMDKYPTTTHCIFSFSNHYICTMKDHILDQKTNFSKFKISEIIQNVCYLIHQNQT